MKEIPMIHPFRTVFCAAICVGAAAVFAVPPMRLATTSSANSLTVRRDQGSTASIGEIAEAVPLEEESLFGKAISGKLSASLIGEHGLDVPGASAVPGDILLQNEKISVVINAPEHTNGNASSGGYIIDGFLNDRPGDRLAQLHLYLNDKYPRMGRFTSTKIISDGSNGPAIVVSKGQDTEDPTIDVTTTYTLVAAASAVELETAVVPHNKALQNFSIGDAFAWGQVSQFVPGSGLDPGKRLDASWIGGVGRGVAYGYYAPGAARLTGPVGSTWADTNVTSGSAQPGEAIVCKRFLAVGHDLAEVSESAWKQAGTTLQKITGSVTETDSNRAASGVRVRVSRNGKALTEAIARDGKFEVQLPAGHYTLEASDTVRSVVNGKADVEVTEGAAPAPLKFTVSSPAVLNLQVEDADREEALPCRLRLFGINGTKDPDLGPSHETRCRNIVYLPKGMDRIPVPEGTYNVVVSRGIDYDMTTVPLRLEKNRETSYKVKLKRAFKVPGTVSADFHLHMKNSFDSAVSLEDRVISCVGEGLDVMVATDHNFITDLNPVIERLGLTNWARAIVGNEITTRKHMFGHFIAFPLIADTNKYGNGATAYEKVTAAQLMAGAQAAPGDQVVQVNHPRAGEIGYFDRLGLSYEDGTTTHLNWSDKFTAIEIFNGKRIDAYYECEHDWFNLLNLGYQFTATGNSDSHKVFDAEPGYPRNYVQLGAAAEQPAAQPGAVVAATPFKPEDIAAAVNQRHAVVVTNGPMITFTTADGKPMGEMVSVKTGPVRFKVKVEGANFVQPNEVHLIANGKKLKVEKIAETSNHLKWEGEFTDEPTADTWYVVRVRGTASMFPIMTPFTEGDLDLDPTPLAVTNPIWIDRDGDGKFTAMNAGKYEMMHQDRSAEALKNIDALTSQSLQRNLFTKHKKMAGES